MAFIKVDPTVPQESSITKSHPKNHNFDPQFSSKSLNHPKSSQIYPKSGSGGWLPPQSSSRWPESWKLSLQTFHRQLGQVTWQSTNGFPIDSHSRQMWQHNPHLVVLYWTFDYSINVDAECLSVWMFRITQPRFQTKCVVLQVLNTSVRMHQIFSFRILGGPKTVA